MTIGTAWVVDRGYCLEFDGANDYVEVASSNSLTMTRYACVSGWVNANLVDNYRLFFTIGVGGGAVNTGDIRIQDANVDAYWHGSGGAFGGRLGTSTIAAGVWYHIVVIFESGQFPLIYVNGVSEGSTTGTAQSFAGSNWKARLGLTLYGDPGAIWGKLDDFLLYDRLPTHSEILLLYSAGNGRRIAYAMRERRLARSAGGMLLQRRRMCA